MANKPHLFFHNQVEGIKKFTPPTRFPGERPEQEEDEVKDYTQKSDDFRRSIDQFYISKITREANRNQELKVPANIDLVKIVFHNIFDSSKFENQYRNNYGMSPISYTVFNTVGLFAIVDEEKFEFFIGELSKFIATTDHLNPNYHPDIKYIKEFVFHSSGEIIHYKEFKPHIILYIIENVEVFTSYINPIEKRLILYLKEKGIQYFHDIETNKIELKNPQEETVKEIANNFDIIQLINSFAAGLVRPSAFNLPDKSYGFEISNIKAELPIIGIIDTGISSETPLKELIINEDNSLNLTASAVTIDEADHGTGVATLAALGKKLYPNHIGKFEADAKLLSIKILDGTNGYIIESEVVRLIKEAHKKYGVQIFTLTIGYADSKLNNEEMSDYAYALDKLSFELNILIFISVGNIKTDDLYFYDGRNYKAVAYPSHFSNENTNLCSPAESMNNITVGAAASNFEDNDEIRISPVGSVPSIYSRTYHVNWLHDSQLDKSGSINWFRANKKLFKPDICNHAGDYNDKLDPTNAGIKVLSVEKGIFFNRLAGTSFSTPLSANLAAKIIKTYPELAKNMQIVKALIINSAEANEIGDAFNNLESILPQSILGNGIPNEEKCIFSSENKVTIIIEDKIKPESIESYPIKIPDYLIKLNRVNSLLKVTATLCFKFQPLKYHHLAYCPIHIAFGIFRNFPLEESLLDENGILVKDSNGKSIPIGINGNKMENIKFAEPWSQDYYFKAKMLSNTQKISFSVSKKVLEEEGCVLKIAINSKLHKLLNDIDKSRLKDTEINFVVILSAEEGTVKNINTNQLYSELAKINNLTALNTSEIILEAES